MVDGPLSVGSNAGQPNEIHSQYNGSSKDEVANKAGKANKWLSQSVHEQHFTVNPTCTTTEISQLFVLDITFLKPQFSHNFRQAEIKDF